MSNSSNLATILKTVQPVARRNRQRQRQLFSFVTNSPLSADELATISKETSEIVRGDFKSTSKKRQPMLPVRHPHRDFFLCDIFDFAIKVDGASMEAPIFSIRTKTDLSIWSWRSKCGSRSVEVYPSVKGRATQHDKDVLIYAISQLTEGLNRGRQDAVNRTVRFVVYDYLVTTNKGVSGDDYMRLQGALMRLAGTRISTDILTGGQRVKEGFGLIDSYKVIERGPNGRMSALEVTLSQWLYNAVRSHEVLTLNREYFRIRKPLERRLYEIVRKQCGSKIYWEIGDRLLKEKCGSLDTLKGFRAALRGIIKADTMPDYRFSLDAKKVVFHTKNAKRLAAGIVKGIVHK